ncbi:uncharacterized protein MONOS_7099 [Monocercomonoides exilis]|uniref:uncharacterized protein n=1 Tax=Monocercomonoides exilis TaxID=2049356 RepID=UPI00355A5C3C|nr:hypothetical protein MONOS_7099 [Monocercomonoides exilis]|eukprot:MONOS_7099.1-p1 / transcript=MONOS_7099.1 / gene=MONOS_7099 / organism=Monocercomonoides_exilis_PA203 / gene_product=unspecified product / transcript_product=unspecified product / location=Mono_scaffold00236:535-1646(-) / protein_length=339 / sequence_SO=supercontig / SO=protein_coding / is_pseudo=false
MERMHSSIDYSDSAEESDDSIVVNDVCCSISSICRNGVEFPDQDNLLLELMHLMQVTSIANTINAIDAIVDIVENAKKPFSPIVSMKLVNASLWIVNSSLVNSAVRSAMIYVYRRIAETQYESCCLMAKLRIWDELGREITDEDFSVSIEALQLTCVLLSSLAKFNPDFGESSSKATSSSATEEPTVSYLLSQCRSIESSCLINSVEHALDSASCQIQHLTLDVLAALFALCSMEVQVISLQTSVFSCATKTCCKRCSLKLALSESAVLDKLKLLVSTHKNDTLQKHASDVLENSSKWTIKSNEEFRDNEASEPSVDSVSSDIKMEEDITSNTYNSTN